MNDSDDSKISIKGGAVLGRTEGVSLLEFFRQSIERFRSFFQIFDIENSFWAVETDHQQKVRSVTLRYYQPGRERERERGRACGEGMKLTKVDHIFVNYRTNQFREI